MYPFHGIDFHKRAYHDGKQSIRKPVYFITKGAFPVRDIVDTFRAVGIIPGNSVMFPLMSIARGMVRSWSR